MMKTPRKASTGQILFKRKWQHHINYEILLKLIRKKIQSENLASFLDVTIF